MRLLSCAVALFFLSLCQNAGWSQEKKPDTKVTQIAGKNIEQWIKEIGSADPSKRENAIRSVMLFGPDRAFQAVPAILEQLKRPPPIDASIRVNGALALGVIMGGLSDPPDPKVMKEAIAVLKRLMGDTQHIVRYRATQALGRIGPEAKETIPELISATKDVNTWETRQAAAYALGFVAREPGKSPGENVIKALFALIGSGTPADRAAQVRLAAIQSITWLGGPGDEKYKAGMIKALEPLAHKDPDPTVQIWAHMAIMSIAHEITDKGIDAVASFLTHQEVAARVQAAQALGTIGPKAKRAIPALIEALSDPEPVVVGWVIYALGRMGSSAIKAIPALERIKNDEKQPEAIRAAARDAIDFINGKTIDPKKIEKK